MADTLDRLLDQYDQGLLSRRQLLKGLAVATGGALAGVAGVAEAAQAQSKPLARAMSINHIHIYVKDMARTVDFYSTVLGAKLKGDQPNNKTITLPGAKPGVGSWISISPGKEDSPDPATRPGSINHAGYGVTFPTSEFDRIAEEIKTRFPDVKPPRVFNSASAGHEIYFYDPDGISLQLIQIDHDGETSGYDPKTGEKLKK